MSPLDPHLIKRQQNTDKTHTQKIQHNSIKSSNTFLLIEIIARRKHNTYPRPQDDLAHVETKSETEDDLVRMETF